MKVQQQITSNICSVLSTIFKRTLAYSMRMIILNPQIQCDQTVRIGHYDSQCQAAQLIVHTLKTCLQKKRMQAFINIKSHANRRFRRTNSVRPKSSIQKRRPESKESSTSSNITWQRPNNSLKSFTPNKKTEVCQIFSRVKLLASDLIQPQSQRRSFGKQNQNFNQINGFQIFNKIEQLEFSLKNLIQKKSKYPSKPEQSTNHSYRKNQERHVSRNIEVSKFDIFF